MKPGRRDTLVGLVVTVLAVVMYGATLSFPSAIGDPLGPGFFPRLLAGMLAGLGVLLAVRGLISAADGAVEPVSLRRPSLVLLLLIGYAFLLSFAGFVAATPMFVFALVTVLGGRPAIAGLAAVAISGGVYTVFEVGLGVQLPGVAIW